jgi:thiamine-phosphate pyrophosphorylase
LTLQRTAALLPARRRLRKTLPALLAFTDPARTPDPEAVAGVLPRGSALSIATSARPTPKPSPGG